jgi:hypothetical protein
MHEKAFATERIRKDFPYYGATYTAEAQVGVTPDPRPAKK